MADQAARGWHDRLLWLLLAAAGIVVAGWAAWSWLGKSWDGSPTSILHGQLVGPFQFLDQEGKSYTPDDVAGKMWIMGFVFTRCQVSCPQIIAAMHRVARQPWANDVRLLALSVDPEHDTPEVLRRYAKVNQISLPSWRFLTGEREQVYDFLEKNFGPLGGKPQVNSNEPPGTRIAHSNRLVLVDQQGRIHDSYLAVLAAANGGFEMNLPELDRLCRDVEKVYQLNRPR